MWSAKYCITWLTENYEEDATSNIKLSEILTKNNSGGGTLSANILGRHILFLFKHVTVKRVWSKDEKRKIRIYAGLKQKSPVPPSHEPLSISDIHQWVPSPYFVCLNNADEVQYAMFGELINGGKLVRKIIFHISGEWEFYIGETKIDLPDLNIENTYNCTRQSIHDVCSIAYKLKVCKGKPQENCHHELFNSNVIVFEYFGEDKIQICRHSLCKRIICPIAFSERCVTCQMFLRPESNHISPEKPIPQKRKLPITSDNKNHNTENDISLVQNSHEDMKSILEQVLPDAPKEMIELLVNQKHNLSRDPKGRRWDKRTISLCLSLWCRSQKNYQQLRDSKILLLPSGRTLSYYKAVVDQQPGFNPDVFQWMMEEARKYKSEGDVLGGVCIDEMSLQEDLCLAKSKGEVMLVGFVDTGVIGESMRLLAGRNERSLATHVLQFLYLGLNGFRFPFACFPVTQTKAGELNFLFWEAVKFLNIYGFKVLFVSMDGAQTNRDFMHMFFENSTPRSNNFRTRNIWSPFHPDITFIMDYSHVIKRVRNCILKSGTEESFVRNLCFNTFIYWDHWVQAFRWDRDTNPFPIHRKLTQEHLFLSQESKMRNKLAEEALNGDMLRLMECFQKSLRDDGSVLDDTVSLLRATSKIVTVFRDIRPLTDTEDERIDDLLTALKWFNDWESFVLQKPDLSSAEKNKQMLTPQTREDLNSCITGFINICRGTLKTNRLSIVPARINSDVIENIFCQQRGTVNGNNTNPTFFQYLKNVNTVILGQNAVSKNSNAEHRGCEPLCFNVNKPLNPRPKKSDMVSCTIKERKPLSVINK